MVMSQKELDRALLLHKVLAKQVSQVQAAQLLGLSDRQIRNLLKKLQQLGPNGLISKKRGAYSNRRIAPEAKAEIMRLINERYQDFGPTLAAEKLRINHRLSISKETLRKWMVAAHFWVEKTSKKKIHPPRQRKAFFGEMLQGDGSHHDWFETGQPCCLIYFIDDATGKITSARFEPTETLDGYFDILEQHLKKFGAPWAIYTDRFSVFETGIKKENLTQFRLALKTLNIDWIGANSPQAKGRIERANRTLQDRLVKEMRIRGIKTLSDGNKFLEKRFIKEYNKKFSKVPMQADDIHRPLESKADLSRILSRYEQRTLSKDFLFQFHNRYYRILKPTTACFRGANVEIRLSRNSVFRVFIADEELAYLPIEACNIPSVRPDIHQLWPDKEPKTINLEHPWRKPSYRQRIKHKQLQTFLSQKEAPCINKELY